MPNSHGDNAGSSIASVMKLSAIYTSTMRTTKPGAVNEAPPEAAERPQN
jgi:hypothetical protein